jgi:GGDEF domain-containing protein
VAAGGSAADAVGVAVSIGVATAPGDGADATAVLAAADGALRAAKRAGRDRVVAAGSAPEAPGPV